MSKKKEEERVHRNAEMRINLSEGDTYRQITIRLSDENIGSGLTIEDSGTERGLWVNIPKDHIADIVSFLYRHDNLY